MTRTNSIKVLALLAAILLIPVFCAASGDAPATEKPEWFFHSIVDAEFVKQYAKMPKPDGVMIIDSRPYKPKYVKGHIPMSVSIPDSQFDKKTDLLPKDKESLLIFYCGGFKCKLSHKSAKKAEKLGYTNVKVFAAGFPAWMKAENTYPEVSLDYIEKEMEKNRMVLVDSRPKKAKYDKGHIPSSVSIPDTKFDNLKGKLPLDKGNLLVFYCGGFKCKLSHKSAAKAMAEGYTNVKVFSAGYPAWKKVHGASGAPALAVKSGKEEGSIDIDNFRKIVDGKPDSVMLVDVRDKDEFTKGKFKGSVNIPVDELEKKIPGLPMDRSIVFVCSTGARSGEAYYMVQDVRPALKDVFYLEAGVTFKKDGSYDINKNPE